jgi:hypothetical protein
MLTDCLIENICNGALRIHHISPADIPELMKKLQNNELDLKVPSNSIKRLAEFINANGVTSATYDFVNTLVEECIQSDIKNNSIEELKMINRAFVRPARQPARHRFS